MAAAEKPKDKTALPYTRHFYVAVALIFIFATILIIGDANLRYAGDDPYIHGSRWILGTYTVYTDTFSEVGPNRFFICFFFLLTAWSALLSAYLHRIGTGGQGWRRTAFLLLIAAAFTYGALDERFTMTINIVRFLHLKPLFRSPHSPTEIHVGHLYILGGVACLFWYVRYASPGRLPRALFIAAFAWHALVALQPYIYQPGSFSVFGTFAMKGDYLYYKSVRLFDFEEFCEMVVGLMYCLALTADLRCEVREFAGRCGEAGFSPDNDR